VKSTLTIDEQQARPVPLLAVCGELDLRGAGTLLANATDLHAAGERSAVWDLSGLRPVAVEHLLTVFPAAQRRLGPWPDRAIHLAGASVELQRQLHSLGVDLFMPIHASVDQALRTAAAGDRALHRHLELTADPRSPGRARRFVDALLPADGDDLGTAAQLLTSELTTNAVRHAGTPFTLSIELSVDDLLIAVRDGSRDEPVLREMRTGATGGRGVQLVDAVSDDWGTWLVHEDGKVVWARLRRPHAA
jgi:anti-sigma regulatory factor (Ser/Thr protein kinase)